MRIDLGRRDKCRICKRDDVIIVGFGRCGACKKIRLPDKEAVEYRKTHPIRFRGRNVAGQKARSGTSHGFISRINAKTLRYILNGLVLGEIEIDEGMHLVNEAICQR